MKGITRVFSLLVLLIGLVTGFSAQAHNSLESSVPEDKAVLSEVPAKLTLEFSDTTWIGEVSLGATSGKTIVLGDLPSGASTRFTLPLPKLNAGKYEVMWVVEGEDTHVIKGSFFFTISDSRYSLKSSESPD